MQTVAELATIVGVGAACDVLAVPRSQFYRAQQPPAVKLSPSRVKAASPRALSLSEKAAVRQELNSARFLDCAPREVYATLLDEGKYLCSWRAMYRILGAEQAVRERRDQLQHPHYARPELVATTPNQLWSWDITRLLGPSKWVFYYLYVILDVYSRYVPGWLIAEQESAELAQAFIAATLTKQGIGAGQLQLHADRGSPMTAKRCCASPNRWR